MARKAKRKRRYSKSSGDEVKSEMRRYKKGTAKSGRGGKGGKVKSRKQAIAIGLSKARKKGKKVPKKKKKKSWLVFDTFTLSISAHETALDSIFPIACASICFLQERPAGLLLTAEFACLCSPEAVVRYLVSAVAARQPSELDHLVRKVQATSGVIATGVIEPIISNGEIAV
jgi:uncharacterized protein DUF6496